MGQGNIWSMKESEFARPTKINFIESTQGIEQEYSRYYVSVLISPPAAHTV